MTKHLSEERITMYVIGDVRPEDRQHTGQCAACQAKIENLTSSLSSFRGAVRTWSEQESAGAHSADLGWMVIPAADHLGRLLLPRSLELPWYRSIWSNVRELFEHEPPLPEITSKPVLVRDTWGLYRCQKKSFVMSAGFQVALVAILCTFASTRPVQIAMRKAVTLFARAPMLPEPAGQSVQQGGGGGGDRSPLPASKGRLPEVSLRQFTPPAQVLPNPNPKLALEPTIVASTTLKMPDVNIPFYGDPLARIGPSSNGPGSGGGIGAGSGGGIGPGKGAGFGPGEGGGMGGGVYRIGGGVSAPVLVYKKEPEYSEEARKAKFQGTVVLNVVVNPDGTVSNLRVVRPLGLGLDEQAVEAVRQWRFKPGYKDGRPVAVVATIEVNFRLL